MKRVKLLSIDKKQIMQIFSKPIYFILVLAAIFEEFHIVLDSISTWQACQLANHDCLQC